MGAKGPCLNSCPNQPNNHTTSSLSVLHLHPNPMLPELGLPTSPLHQIHLPSYPSTMGHLSFLKRVSRFGLPETSWRSKCPYHLPPPLILAKGTEEAQWGDEQKRENFRKRMRRKRLGGDVNPVLPILVPNLLLLSLLFWNPFP
ncbi:uncharacterized protein Pyn_30440 [Prunus yedoensis var. nudiflora]|uniref:Uncharacterized protein n=1 Tax=Prunus yedoensis var. nudiflora TaxID=2094558 RepID=A0A314ZK81_PRUYE|nr:uncharacterized protein Pyn_30440 [Prunus yedoensis var. nudiflora]